ncbi:MAG: transcriptional regulator [Candidatus Bathyarchaeota archaeon]|nr:transcriptional regulator [Candidatus Bathyarchaeota archaeon]
MENKQYNSSDLLTRITKLLEGINTKLDILTQQNAKILENSFAAEKPANHTSSDIMTLLTLPASVRKTGLALLEFEKATAQDLALKTGRSRPVESDCANQLVRIGFAKKKREGMEIYFFTEPLEVKH